MNFQKIKLLALDVDGVLTDGIIFENAQGELFKNFYAKDGLAINAAQKQGLKVAFITGRGNGIVAYRARELGVPYCFEEVKDKVQVLQQLMDQFGLTAEEVAYMGDDLNDLGAFRLAGVKLAPADAAADVVQRADYVAAASGGRGAVREVIEKIMRDQGKWSEIVDKNLGSRQ